MAFISEDDLEQMSLEWFQEIGYTFIHGPLLAPDGETPERDDFRQVVLTGRLRSALTKLNPGVPAATIESAVLQLANPNTPGLLPSNRQFHRWMTTGLPITFMDGNQEVGIRLKMIGFDDTKSNDWLVVNQLAIQGPKHNRRPDVVVYLNGLPIAVLELKNPADEKADIWAAFNQLQTYKDNIPDLFTSNVLMVISDGTYARVGSLSASKERFQQWRVIDAEQDLDPLGKFRELETLIRGLFDQKRLLDFIRFFCLFEDDGKIIKKIAAYHQFHAVRAAVERVAEASKPGGDRKGGVVWHTQGAGKSIEMACLAGKLLTDQRLQNPTLVMVTDRQDLDGQLFGVFAGAGDLLGENPQQADSRQELRDLLANRPSGGIIFTTIQKFGTEDGEDKFPTLSDRHNVVVICDEAHRTQYGFKGRLDTKTGEIKYGLAKALRDALPEATFLAFTGTPISQDDRDTQAVFGHYVSVYDIQQAVEDGATVPIYYESRLAKLGLKESVLSGVDDQVDDLFTDEDDIPAAERAKSRWAALEALVGAEPRLKQVAADLVRHYEQRSKTQPGKAMVVAMSRDICARLYDAIKAIRPDWHDPDISKGAIKVVMTASASDDPHLQPHHTSKQQKKDLEKRFKDPADPLKIVIVRDMWLTGFDAERPDDLLTPLRVSRHGACIGRIVLQFLPDDHWLEAAEMLHQLGIRLHVVSSLPDDQLDTCTEGLQLPDDQRHGACDAEARLALIRRLQGNGSIGVAYMGYLLQDLAALEQADVSMGMTTPDDSLMVARLCDLMIPTNASWLPRLVTMSRRLQQAETGNFSLITGSQIATALITASGWIAPMQAILFYDLPMLLAELNNILCVQTAGYAASGHPVPSRNKRHDDR